MGAGAVRPPVGGRDGRRRDSERRRERCQLREQGNDEDGGVEIVIRHLVEEHVRDAKTIEHDDAD